MISTSYDIEDFIRAIEKKGYPEIIGFASMEATAAWRSAYRQRKSGKAADELLGQYEHALKELISFLRAAITYRPVNVRKEVFDRFLQIRENLAP